jgi:hypothetical protein
MADNFVDDLIVKTDETDFEIKVERTHRPVHVFGKENKGQPLVMPKQINQKRSKTEKAVGDYIHSLKGNK